MKSIKTFVALTLFALVASFGMTQSAHAQKGSRLCGWIANFTGQNGPQAIAFLYEIRTADKSDGKQCSGFISEIEKNAIRSNPQLSQLPFQKVEKATCESVGEIFKSAQYPSNDMCDYMEAKSPYKVDKGLVNGAPVTVYTRL